MSEDKVQDSPIVTAQADHATGASVINSVIQSVSSHPDVHPNVAASLITSILSSLASDAPAIFTVSRASPRTQLTASIALDFLEHMFSAFLSRK